MRSTTFFNAQTLRVERGSSAPQRRCSEESSTNIRPIRAHRSRRSPSPSSSSMGSGWQAPPPMISHERSRWGCRERCARTRGRAASKRSRALDASTKPEAPPKRTDGSFRPRHAWWRSIVGPAFRGYDHRPLGPRRDRVGRRAVRSRVLAAPDDVFRLGWTRGARRGVVEGARSSEPAFVRGRGGARGV